MSRHLTDVHKIDQEIKRKKLKCSDCLNTFPSRAAFLTHIQVVHDISIQTIELNFENECDFEKWKLETESDTTSKFMKTKPYRNSAGYEIVNFVCHRTGTRISKSKKKRYNKVRGSIQIPFFCPANISVQTKQKSSLFPATITYCPRHLGHKCETGKLKLNKEEKDMIAGQLISGVPMQDVLCNVISNARPASRLASTNMQDLRNISLEYGLAKHILRRANDLISVDSWVHEMMEGDSNPIL